MSYLYYNWKFVPFEPLILPIPTHLPTSNRQLISVSMSSVFVWFVWFLFIFFKFWLLVYLPTNGYLEDIPMAKSHMEGCSKSPIIRKIQTKNTTTHHLTPARMTSIEKTRNKFWQGCGEKRTPVYC